MTNGVVRKLGSPFRLSMMTSSTLSAFQKKLNLLYLSIRTYTMTYVWNNATAGMLDRNNGEIAQIAMRRWRRAATIR